MEKGEKGNLRGSKLSFSGKKREVLGREKEKFFWGKKRAVKGRKGMF